MERVCEQFKALCSEIHIWSLVVRHKFFDFVDIAVQGIVVAPWDQALY